MPEQPRDALTNVLGEMADRMGKYAEIMQQAVARNASDNYSADDALKDMQRTFTLALRDMAEVSATVIEAVSAATAPKKAPAKKKASAKKAAARRGPK